MAPSFTDERLGDQESCVMKPCDFSIDGGNDFLSIHPMKISNREI
jgi:hypothetical protein